MKKFVILIALFVILINPGCLKKGPELVFSVKKSGLRLQDSTFATKKKADDLIEITLPGYFHVPPTSVRTVNKRFVDRNILVGAASSAFSAKKANDIDWIIENYADEEQGQMRSQLEDKETQEKNEELSEKLRTEYITSQTNYNEYTIFFIQDDFTDKTHTRTPVVYKRTEKGYKLTNALSNDEIYDIISAALRAGDIRAK